MEPYDSIVVAVNSRDCSTGSPYGGTCTFNIQTIVANNVLAMRVKQWGTELSFYNVESSANGGKNWNITLYMIGNVTGPFTVAIPQGAYNITTLLAAIDLGILTATGTTTVSTYSTVTQFITITRTAGTDATLQMDFASAGANSYGMTRLGFMSTLPLAASITATQSYVLMLTQSMLLCSNVLSSFRCLQSGQTPLGLNKSNVISQCLIGTGNSWDFVSTQIPTNFFQLDNIAHLSTIDFSLTDDLGYPIVLHQQGYSFMLEILIKKGQ